MYGGEGKLRLRNTRALARILATPYRRAMPSPDAPHPLPDIAALIADARAGHAVALGVRYMAHGDDWCELAIGYDRRLISDTTTGVLASGPIVSLIDMAAAISVWLRRGEQIRMATLDLRLDYLCPARAGHAVTARMECYRLGRRIAFVRGIAHDGDPAGPIAHAAGTFALAEQIPA